MAFVETLKNAINFFARPYFFITIVAILFFAVLNWRGFWKPKVAVVLGVLGAAFLGVSMKSWLPFLAT